MPRNRTPDPAPHGRDPETGAPLAPYGLNLDGTPRKSNRGRRSGSAAPSRRPAGSGGSAPRVTTNLKDSQRKSMLCDLADMLIVAPLATASQAPMLVDRLGRHADALAGDAFILSQFVPGLADGMILLSKTKPAALSWLDKAEGNAPYFLLAQVGFQMAKAIADNHMRPNPRVAEAGRNLAALKIAAMAEAVNAEADRIAAMSRVEMPPDPEPYPAPVTVDYGGDFDAAGDPTVQFAAVA